MSITKQGLQDRIVALPDDYTRILGLVMAAHPDVVLEAVEIVEGWRTREAARLAAAS